LIIKVLKVDIMAYKDEGQIIFLKKKTTLSECRHILFFV